MSLVLACGSIVEVFTGAVCSTIVCIGLLMFFGMKYFKSDSYRRFKAAETAEKSVIFIMLSFSVIIVSVIAWWIMTLLFSLIVVWVTK